MSALLEQLLDPTRDYWLAAVSRRFFDVEKIVMVKKGANEPWLEERMRENEEKMIAALTPPHLQGASRLSKNP